MIQCPDSKVLKKKSAYIPSKHKGYGVHVEILHTLGRDKKLSPCNSVYLLSVNLFSSLDNRSAPEPSPRCLTAARYKWKPRKDVVCSQVLAADMFWKPRKRLCYFLLYVPISSICVMLHLCHVTSTKIMDMIMLFFDLLYVPVSSVNRS